MARNKNTRTRKNTRPANSSKPKNGKPFDVSLADTGLTKEQVAVLNTLDSKQLTAVSRMALNIRHDVNQKRRDAVAKQKAAAAQKRLRKAEAAAKKAGLKVS